MSKSVSLKYEDREDRAYGLTGMAFTLLLYEQGHLLQELWLDAPADMGLVMAPQASPCGSPALAASAVIKDNVRRYRLGQFMLVGNVLARVVVRRKKELTPEVVRSLEQLACQEASGDAQLATDEAVRALHDAIGRLYPPFQDRGVPPVMREIVAELLQKRRLSRHDFEAHFTL